MTRDFESVVRAASLLALGVINMPTAAIAAGMSEADFSDQLADEAVLAAAEKEALRLQASGKASELRATLALDTLVAQLHQAAETGEISDGAAVRVGEFLLKVSGATERRTAELRLSQPGKPLCILQFGGSLSGEEGAPFVRMAHLQPTHPAYETVRTGKNSKEQFALLERWEAEHGDQA
jgi:hypothetical protein